MWSWCQNRKERKKNVKHFIKHSIWNSIVILILSSMFDFIDSIQHIRASFVAIKFIYYNPHLNTKFWNLNRLLVLKYSQDLETPKRLCHTYIRFIRYEIFPLSDKIYVVFASMCLFSYLFVISFVFVSNYLNFRFSYPVAGCESFASQKCML